MEGKKATQDRAGEGPVGLSKCFTKKKGRLLGEAHERTENRTKMFKKEKPRLSSTVEDFMRG